MSLIARVHNKFRKAVLGARYVNYPTNLSSRCISRRKWEKIQHDHELNYWVHEFPKQVPPGLTPREYHMQRAWVINRRMFGSLVGRPFEEQVVLDVGCGPYGSMDYSGARLTLGVDPLARAYQNHCEITPGLVILSCDAEHVPLLDRMVDVVVSVNALDHFHHPYDALEEMWRVLKPGGRFLLSTDIEGTPRHPVKIRRQHLDEFCRSKDFEVIEQDAGTHLPNDWPKEMEIPLYVFHGIRRGGPIECPAAHEPHHRLATGAHTPTEATALLDASSA